MDEIGMPGAAAHFVAAGPPGRTMQERRNLPRTPEDFLQQLPALVLLDRLSTPTLITGLDGFVVYANPACRQLLGYRNGARLAGQSLSELLVEHSGTAAEDCVALLGVPNTIVKWKHTDEYPERFESVPAQRFPCDYSSDDRHNVEPANWVFPPVG